MKTVKELIEYVEEKIHEYVGPYENGITVALDPQIADETKLQTLQNVAIVGAALDELRPILAHLEEIQAEGE